MDFADKWARDALKGYRRGSQINAGCVEIYDAVAPAIRDAFAQGAIAGSKGATTPTQDAYNAACKALTHWRAEANRLGSIAGQKPREMTECNECK